MKPRILLLTPQLPFPPEQGTSLRNYNILRGLLRRYSVTLLSFTADQPSQEALNRLSGCEAVITVPAPKRTLVSRLTRMATDRRPDMAHRLQSSAFNEKLADLLRKGSGVEKCGEMAFDVVQVEGIELSFALEIVRSLSPSSKIIFDDHNVEYELQRRAYLADRSSPGRWPAAIYSRVQAARLREYERQICNRADHVVAVSENDGRLLRELGIRAPVSVIPNSIDLEEYTSEEEPAEQFDLVFIGKMDYRPNIDAVLWFAGEVWPQLKLRRPETSWVIVGKNPHARLENLKEMDGITVTGWVDRVQPYFQGSRICLMPFRVGSGTRLKLIEAMASARAIVSTTVGAEGFDVRSGEQLILVDEPPAFADAILALLGDSRRRRELGSAARRFAARYDWREVSPLFYEIIDGLLGKDDDATKGQSPESWRTG